MCSTHTMTQRCVKHPKSYSSLEIQIKWCSCVSLPILCNKISSRLIIYLVLVDHTVLLVLDFDQFPLAKQLCSQEWVKCWQELWGDIPIFIRLALFSLQNQEKRVIMQGFQSLGLELTSFSQTLVTYSKSQVEPRLQGREVDSTSSLGRSAMLQRA